MNIDSIKNGIVIDHITAGKAMELYFHLGLDKTDYHVAIIKNANSKKMGKKDIIKVDGNIKLDIDAIGYFDPGATVTIIKNSEVVEKKKITLPERITNVILCKNPRCIIRKFTVHVLLKPGLESFEHYFTSMCFC